MPLKERRGGGGKGRGWRGEREARDQRGVRESQHLDQSIEVELLFDQHWEGAL